MSKRILLGAVLAGMAMFLWEGLAHMVLPLGEAGVSAVPHEAEFLASVQPQFQTDGLYLFPAPENRPGMSAGEKNRAMTAATELARKGPSGLLLIHPSGAKELSPRQFVTQVAMDMLAMLVAGLVLARSATGGYLSRVGLVAALGLLPALTMDASLWNWYGFPAAYAMAEAVTSVVGFAVGGLVLAKLVPSAAR